MDLIKNYYPKNTKITILKKPLSEQIRKHLLIELGDKDFIQDDLHKLMKSSYYYGLT